MRLLRNNVTSRIENTLVQTLKMEVIEDDNPTSVTIKMPVGRFNCQSLGLLHGGATIALGETAAGIGSNNICDEDKACVGMQISTNHISSAQIGDVVRAEAELIHKGHTTHVWDVNVFSENTGKLISSLRVTNSVIKRPPINT
ncbi:1,4-dihydroxy-2-naphthoyl-CoA hydrolase [Dysgonomonas sp. PH5-45]|uniref:PaaI family thioesterase n=1 Tax=unclassified Dysgonomonas TaxID=2630389 RepID=UPI002473610C|nr:MULTISPECIES: PaaI family thioesterase [unclassified Dysgonomonas]MDH6354939.1 1,4-dihydroxy-2-naphthoyl-CoA hydrolase [Dysgonomonas sp. PH5-45]MDH6387838.1 1,4-dihydroxy-2-naphthoyl-CoA hydrolase [Dysgonomonas sp. PH5-37]